MEPETIEDVLALIQQRPADSELYQRLGQLYAKAGRSDEARGAYERSLELDPKDAFTHLYLGNWFYGSRMYSDALAWFQRAAELLPHQPVVYWCQGDAYRALGQYHLAQKAYQTAIHVAPHDQEARHKMAEWEECRRGTTDATPRMIRDACRSDQAATTVLLASRWLQDHPDDLWVIHDYAEMLYQMTRYEEAICVYMDAIERFQERRGGYSTS